MKKLLFTVFAFIVGVLWFGLAENYIFFYAEACPNCQSVEKFFDVNWVYQKYSVSKKEIRNSKENLDLFANYLEKLWLSVDWSFVPFMVIDDGNNCGFVEWSNEIKQYFAEKMWIVLVCDSWLTWSCISDSICETSQQCKENVSCKTDKIVEDTQSDKVSLSKRFAFFGVMLLPALWDAINPCAFAVILMILIAILSEGNNRRKAIKAGLAFSLAIYLWYLLMWIGFQAMLKTTSFSNVFQIVAAVLWIIVGLANLKDYFWYGRWFVMEVPLARRPKMQKIIYKVSSPLGAFLVGFIVSLFLLPCSGGPYFTIIFLIQSQQIENSFWWYLYLIVYNLIFILPMVLITFLVWMWARTPEDLAKIKNKYKKQIHLIVWILMLLLSLYIILDILNIWIF